MSFKDADSGASNIPTGVFTGERAVNTQSYTESNTKLGLQQEGSAIFLGVAGGANNDTIFITGSKPVILKSRRITFSGSGVVAFIYELPTYTGGTSAVYQNANAINPVAGESQIIIGATITTDGILIFSPNYFIGNQSNQGKGDSGSSFGEENIMKPNTTYLLRITSLDSQPQDIASHLSWFEGEPDLPL